MIRARLGTTLLLGIDAENVRRLQSGQPIHVHKAEVDNGEDIAAVVIVYGDTLQDIVNDMKREGALPPDFVMPAVVKGTKQ